MARAKKQKSSMWDVYLSIAKFKLDALDIYMSPIMNFIIRLYMGIIFWKSGMLKLADSEYTISLFANAHRIPMLPAHLAAHLSTYLDLICAIMLFVGFGARAASFFLIIITLFLMSIYPGSETPEYWLLLLGFILCYGPGRLSVDHYIKGRFLK